MPDTHPPHVSLIDHLKDLPDPRVNRTRDHELVDILIIAICTLLCGGESFYDMEDFGKAKREWFATFLRLPNGIPSHDTFTRLFARLDPASFRECFMRWTAGLREAVHQEIVALDGKALRHAKDAGEEVRYIVNAWAESNRLVLGQLKVTEKSNEITALPGLLRALDLAGCIVTTDAMGCQKKVAREIIEADADYVLALKGNHETVHQEVQSFLDDEVKRQAKPAAPRMGATRRHRSPSPAWRPATKATAGLKPVIITRAPMWRGLKISDCGKACVRWEWWKARGRSVTK